MAATTLEQDALEVPQDDDDYLSEVSSQGDAPPPYRRDSESSTERSLYDEKDIAKYAPVPDYEDGPGPSSAPARRQFNMYYPSFNRRSIIITAPANLESTPTSAQVEADQPVYYADVSYFNRKKPDVALRAIPASSNVSIQQLEQVKEAGENGPILSVAQIPRTTRTVHVGLGNPDTNLEMRWFDIVNPNKYSHGDLRFTYRGRNLAWQRTHEAEDGVDGGSVKRNLTRNSFVLLDLDNGERYAVFLENKWKSWKKAGKLILLDAMVGADEEMSLMVFTSLTAVLEAARRRKNRRIAAGSAGS